MNLHAIVFRNWQLVAEYLSDFYDMPTRVGTDPGYPVEYQFDAGGHAWNDRLRTERLNEIDALAYTTRAEDWRAAGRPHRR